MIEGAGLRADTRTRIYVQDEHEERNRDRGVKCLLISHTGPSVQSLKKIIGQIAEQIAKC